MAHNGSGVTGLTSVHRHTCGKYSVSGVTGGPAFTIPSSSVFTSNGTTQSSGVITAPASLRSGNLLLAFVHGYVGVSTPVFTPPSGFTEVGTLLVSDTASAMELFAKTVTGSEPGSYTFTGAAAPVWDIALIQVAGFASGTDGGATLLSAASSATWSTSSFTAGHANDFLLMGVWGQGDGTSVGAGPAGATLVNSVVDTNETAGLYIYSLQLGTGTTVAAQTGHWHTTAARNTAIAVAIH